jgi:hypothetical protein
MLDVFMSLSLAVERLLKTLGDGKMVLRKGPHGQFWGGSHYCKEVVFGCSHTGKFINLKAAKPKSLPIETAPTLNVHKFL